MEKNAFHLRVNVLNTKALIGDTIFTFPTGDGTFILRGYPRYARVYLAICRAKAVPSFLSHFKTLSVGPVPEIEPATSRSAVKHSTDWANLAAVKLILPYKLYEKGPLTMQLWVRSDASKTKNNYQILSSRSTTSFYGCFCCCCVSSRCKPARRMGTSEMEFPLLLLLSRLKKAHCFVYSNTLF